jgi:hypothetical protein
MGEYYMKNNAIAIAGFLLATLMLGEPFSSAAQTPQTHDQVAKNPHERQKKLARKGGWAGAGLAAATVAGPAGSAAVGATKYRKDLKEGGRKRTNATAKVGAPIAAGVVAGPAGSAGALVVIHRNWIKQHVFHRHA